MVGQAGAGYVRRMTAAITVSHLMKSFGPTKALDDLDLQVETGEVHGFLGPNGSGESATIRVCSGCCTPTPVRPPSRRSGTP